ncbi:hypothetical protein SEA_SIXAMA_116 [Gordonia phage Sixama]|uniref:Uncharacterized protein n=1 Tax=Gordonia phage Sixama TaxID=2653271 RepID=A0A5Q2F752_9CAUD|nr:hypothetical protein PP302_gp116 [Gordonia phage Sixama]QGF20295.1 hypothetical protein SEA_SIXAMA_116 [Gordonia phage Sixama]
MVDKTWVDLRKIPYVSDFLVRDVEVQYPYSDTRLKPPPMNRFSHPEATALHYESTRIRRDKWEFRVVNAAATAAGPYYVYEQIDCDVRLKDGEYEVTQQPEFQRTVVETDVVETFRKFMRLYETSMQERSLRIDNATSTPVYELTAAASPFFYPLNKTNVKYLIGKEGKNHAVWLHKQMLEYWTEFAVTVENEDTARLIRDEDAMPMTLYSSDYKEKRIVENSIIWRMLNTLASATSSEGIAKTYPSAEPLKPQQVGLNLSIK